MAEVESTLLRRRQREERPLDFSIPLIGHTSLHCQPPDHVVDDAWAFLGCSNISIKTEVKDDQGPHYTATEYGPMEPVPQHYPDYKRRLTQPEHRSIEELEAHLACLRARRARL